MRRQPSRLPVAAFFVLLFVVVQCSLWIDRVSASSEGTSSSSSKAATIAASKEICGRIKRCSECLLDPSNSMFETRHVRCYWCQGAGTCTANQSTCAGGAHDALHMPKRDSNELPKCDDLRCGLVHTTNNIYFCRFGMVITLALALVLVVFNIFFYLWMRTLHQYPWKYENIHVAVRNFLKERGSVLAIVSRTKKTRPSSTGMANDSIICPPDQLSVASMAQHACPMCKQMQLPGREMGPGEVCFWCNVARWSFLPFYIGCLACGLALAFLVLASLKPWFADLYYTYLMVVSYGAYALFLFHVCYNTEPIAGDEKEEVSCFFQLAWILRGRKLSNVFPMGEDEEVLETFRIQPQGDERREEEETEEEKQSAAAAKTTATATAAAAAEATQAVPEGTATATATATSQRGASHFEDDFGPVSPTTVNKYKAETAQLLQLDTTIPKDFRKRLLIDIKNDEFIVWWEQPPFTTVCFDNMWLLHFFASFIAIGLWMMLSSNVPPTYAMNRFFSPAALQATGTLMILCFGVLVCIILNSCNRLFVLTNKRLFVLADGLLGSTHASFTELSGLKCAAVHGYDEWVSGPVIVFSWVAPQDGRKLPPIMTDRMAGVTNIEGLLQRFREYAPTLQSQALRANMRHQRLVWRLHICCMVLLLLVLPVIFIYSRITPPDLGFIGMLCFGSIALCILRRGTRFQQLTSTRLSFIRHWKSVATGYGGNFLSKMFYGNSAESGRRRKMASGISSDELSNSTD